MSSFHKSKYNICQCAVSLSATKTNITSHHHGPWCYNGWRIQFLVLYNREMGVCIIMAGYAWVLTIIIIPYHVDTIVWLHLLAKCILEITSRRARLRYNKILFWRHMGLVLIMGLVVIKINVYNCSGFIILIGQRPGGQFHFYHRVSINIIIIIDWTIYG